ncbi:tetratricopeptide repeat protein [Fibrobacterota bacterium]
MRTEQKTRHSIFWVFCLFLSFSQAAPTKSTPQDYSTWHKRGHELIKKSKFTDAEKALIKALKVKPDGKEALMGLSEVYRHLLDSKPGDKKTMKKAAAHYQKIHRISPALLMGDTTAITVLFKEKKYEIAAILADKYLEFKPKNLKIRELRIQCFRESGKNREKLREAMQTLLELDPENKNWWLELAQLDLKAGDSTTALKNAKTWVQRNPESLEGYKFLLPLVAGKEKEAATHALALEKLANLKPGTYGHAITDLGLMKYNQGKWAEAESLLTIAASSSPDNAEVWYKLGMIRARSGEEHAGQPEFDTAYKLKPGNLDYARTYGRSIKTEQGLKDNLKLLEFLDGNSPNIDERMKLAKSYYLNGNYKASASKWKALVEIDEAFTRKDSSVVMSFLKGGLLDHAVRYAPMFASHYEYNLELAEKLDSAGMVKEAVIFYETALGLQSGNTKVKTRLAELYQSLKKTDKALEAFQQALDENSKDKILQKKYMDLVEKTGSREDMKDAYEFILDRDSTVHQAMYGLAKLLLKEKDKKTAYQHLSRALKLKPKNRDYQALLPRVIEQENEIKKHFSLIKKLAAVKGADGRTKALCAKGHALRGERGKAARLYQEAYKLDKNLLQKDTTAILTFFQAKKYGLAEKLAQDYLALDPKNRHIREIHIITLEKVGGDRKKLREAIIKFLVLDPNTRDWWLKLARLDLEEGDTAAAVKHALSWVERNQESVKGYNFLLPLIAENEKYRAAYGTTLEILISLDPKTSASNRLKLANLKYSDKSFTEAEALLKKSAVKYPKNAGIWFRLGKIRARPEFKGDGKKELKKACDLDPDNLDYLRGYASELQSDEEVKDNLKVFTRLAESSPNLEERTKLARAYSLHGKHKESSGEWKKLMKMDTSLVVEWPSAVKSFLKSGHLKEALVVYELKLKDTPEDLESLEKAFELYRKTGQKEKAHLFLRKIVKLKPEYKDYQLALAQAVKDMGKAREAISEYERWLAKKPRDKKALKEFYQLVKQTGDTIRMVSALSQLVKVSEGDLEYHRELGLLLVKRGKLKKAGKHLEVSNTGKKLDEQVAYALYKVYRASKNRKGALEQLRSLAGFKPGEKKYAYPLARLEYISKNYSAVIKLLEHPELKPGLDEKRSFLLLKTYVRTKNASRAEGYGERLLRLFPKTAEQSLDLGVLFFHQKNKRDAKRILDKVTAVKPSPRAWYYRGMIAYYEKDWNTAAKMLEKAGKRPIKVKKYLATANKKISRYKKAAKALETYYQANPTPELLPKLYFLHKKAKDRENSFRVLEKMEKAFPGNQKYKKTLAKAYLARGDTSKMESLYRKVLKSSPRDAEANLYWGMEQARAGKCRKAIKHLKTGLEKITDVAEAWELLGDCQSSRKNRIDALKAYRIAFNLKPSLALALAKLRLIKKLQSTMSLPEAYQDVINLDSSHAEAAQVLAKREYDKRNFSAAAALYRWVVLKVLNDSEIWENYGIALKETGKLEKAGTALKTALSLGSETGRAELEFARIKILTGEWMAAEKLLNDCLIQNKKQPEVHAELAEIALQNGRLEEAESHLLQALKYDRNNPTYLESLGNLYYDGRQMKKALKVFSQIKAGLSVRSQMRYAGILRQAGREDRAFKAYKKLHKKKPSLESAVILADMYLEKQNTGAALNIINKPEYMADVRAQTSLLKIELAQGRLSHVHKKVKRLIRKNRKNAYLHFMNGLCFFKKADYPKAEHAFGAALQLKPSYPEALFFLGKSKIKQRDFPSATKHFNELKQGSPIWKAKAYLGLAQISIMKQDHARAEDQLKKSIYLARSTTAARMLAKLALKRNDLKTAHKWAKRANSLDPEDPMARLAKADFLIAQKKIGDARQVIKEALEKLPGSCDLLLNLEKLNFMEDKGWRGSPNSEKVMELCPEKEMAYYYRGLWARKLSDNRGARKYFSLFEKHGGDPGLVKQEK